MAYEVVMTSAAEEDYLEILEYLEQHFSSETAARSFVQEMMETCTHLQAHPQMYEMSRAPELQPRGYRKFLIGKYGALYRIDETKHTVFIARLFHGSQNYSKYL